MTETYDPFEEHFDTLVALAKSWTGFVEADAAVLVLVKVGDNGELMTWEQVVCSEGTVSVVCEAAATALLQFPSVSVPRKMS